MQPPVVFPADPDISTIPPDLCILAVTSEIPGSGRRVLYRLPDDPETVPEIYFGEEIVPRHLPVIIKGC